MDEFYQKTYLMIVFKWSYYYTRKNMKNIRCDIIEDTKHYHTVRFYLKNRVAFLTVWHNGIIEEQITDEEGKEIYFYLHYTLKSLSQFLSYYRDFMVVFLRDADPKHVKVGIVDQDGFSSSYLIGLSTSSISSQSSKDFLEMRIMLPMRIVLNRPEFASLSSLEEVEGDYDALYLSPSVMHLKGDIESIVSVPVYVIDPLVYATNDFYTLIHTILSK